MLSLSNFLTEAILHIEHPADRTFDGKAEAKHALKTLSGVAERKAPNMTRKIDDKMSFNVIRRADGSVGVKYKGKGANYNFSDKDIDTQHGHKPYLAEPLKLLLKHLPKVLPDKPGEYQGGYMSGRDAREHEDGQISHTPNTIKYSYDVNSPEGKALSKSKVSAVIHTKLNPNGTVSPLTSMAGFKHHPDVHLVHHLVTPEQAAIPKQYQDKVDAHLAKAKTIIASHTYQHLNGHEQTLRQYINAATAAENTPSTEGYKKYLRTWHQKKIDAVKTDAAKTRKTKEMNDAIDHVSNNQSDFYKTFELHHHMQQATNNLARGLHQSEKGSVRTSIGGQEAAGEGHVFGGLKIVDREGFSRANRARAEILKANRT